MKQAVLKGATSQILFVFIRDSSASTGVGKTGLAFDTASLVASYVRPGAARQAITLATQTVTGAFSSGGFVEVDSANMPGIYRLDVPDAVFATGVNSAVVMLKGAANMEPVVIEFQLTGVDLQNAVRMGLSSLPNAAAEAAGGLFTRGTGAGQINQDANGRVDVNIAAISTDATAADNLEAYTDGTTPMPVNVTQFGGTNATATGGRPEVNTTHAAGTAWNSGAIGSATLAADTLTAAKVAADVTTELQAGLATASALATVSGKIDTIDDFVDTEVAAIKAKTDQLVFTVANQVDVNVVDWKGATAPAMTGDAFARLGAPAGASVSADMAAVKAETAAILDDTDDIGVAGAGLTALASAANLAIVAGYIDTEVGAIKAVTDKLDQTLENTSDGWIFEATALQNAPSGGGGGPTAADIADAVWDEGLAGHAGVGSAGAALTAAGSAGDPWSTPLPGAYGAGTAGEIIGNALDAAISSRASAADLATVDSNVDAIQAKTDNLPSDPADASVVAGLIAAVETKVDTVDTVVDAIKAKTDNLPGDPADASVIAGLIGGLDAKLDTIDGNVDAVLLDTGTDGVIVAAGSKSGYALSSAGVDAIHDEAVDGATTARESMRLANAALGGKASGLETTEATFRDLADTKDRIVATVDVDGNRSVVTRDLS